MIGSLGSLTPISDKILPISPKAEAKARKVAGDFESMFLEQMLGPMFENAGESGPLGDNGTGGAVYRSMLVKEYATNIAKGGGIGIANSVYSEILRLQEGRGA